MKDLAVVIQNSNKKVTVVDTIIAIKDAGFKNVFIQWYDSKKWKVSQEEQVKFCNKLGLNIIFAHLGYYNIDYIWQEGEKGEEIIQNYIQNLNECSKYSIPMVIMHLTNSDVLKLYNEVGLKRIKQLVEHAKKLNIKIAFENTKVNGYLEYVLKNITDSNVGICFDTGHYHAHFKDEFDFELFKNRIFAVHIHDNNGIKDEHLIPFDGNNDFYKKSYDVGLKLLDMFNNS